MSDNRDLKNKGIRILINQVRYSIPEKVLGQIHTGLLLALRKQVPPLKQYGMELLHGLIRISQNLKVTYLDLQK
jgi:hypothetical protein